MAVTSNHLYKMFGAANYDILSRGLVDTPEANHYGANCTGIDLYTPVEAEWIAYGTYRIWGENALGIAWRNKATVWGVLFIVSWKCSHSHEWFWCSLIKLLRARRFCSRSIENAPLQIYIAKVEQNASFRPKTNKRLARASDHELLQWQSPRRDPPSVALIETDRSSPVSKARTAQTYTSLNFAVNVAAITRILILCSCSPCLNVFRGIEQRPRAIEIFACPMTS